MEYKIKLCQTSWQYNRNINKLTQAYGNQVLFLAQTFRQHKSFLNGWETMENELSYFMIWGKSNKTKVSHQI